MKQAIEKLIAMAFSSKVHANHSAIKGNKSGGSRDNNGKDWRKDNTGAGMA